MKHLFLIVSLAFSTNAMAEWIEYSARPNGDVFYYDNARVEKNDNHISVWSRVRFKRSVMAASSYQSFLRIDCAKNSETVLQSTFYTDKDWTTPAMATNTNVKPEKPIKADSATGQLVGIFCARIKKLALLDSSASNYPSIIYLILYI